MELWQLALAFAVPVVGGLLALLTPLRMNRFSSILLVLGAASVYLAFMFGDFVSMILAVIAVFAALALMTVLAAAFGTKISQRFYKSLGAALLFPWWLGLTPSLIYSFFVAGSLLLAVLARRANSSLLPRRREKTDTEAFNPMLALPSIVASILVFGLIAIRVL